LALVKLVVGLGNPGKSYASTRHNIGARIVERFGADCGIALVERRFGGRFGIGRLPPAESGPTAEVQAGEPELAILAPETFMNRSGGAVAEAVEALRPEDLRRDLLLVFDDVDLPFGRLRLRPHGGSGGHRGLQDVINRLGRSDFPRLRFGVGRPEERFDTVDWVLQPFSVLEEAALERGIPLAAEALLATLVVGVASAMNRYNRGPDAAD
jgi:PTH1 family peptidyl-tRNA hydrolase